jgi:hypothetical protein
MPSEQAQHCPFLNRADTRCSDAFSLEKLDHAYKYCFGRYTFCSIYMELLVERRLRRSGAAVMSSTAEQDDACKTGTQRVIQVSVRRPPGADRDAKHPARGQGLPALPGV